MFAPRVIPVLTIIGDGLYRTRRFKKPSYVGDPLNAIRIFNEKEVDELVVLDITPERRWNDERLQLFEEMAAEAFMPTTLGGCISSVEQVERAFIVGYDKVVINSAAFRDIDFVQKLTDRYGGQSIVISIDVGTKFLGGRTVYSNLGRKAERIDPVQHALRCESAGAGEIIVRSIDHDGLMGGFDLELIEQVSSAVKVPVVAAGGAGNIQHLKEALEAGAHSVSAGSMFVYHGPHRAVLINYPSAESIQDLIGLGISPSDG
jgi:cyclase